MTVGIARIADGEPVERRRRDGRALLLKGARQLLAEKGYAGMELRDVAERGKAPRGSIYHHFPGGKAELGDEVIRKAGAFFQALVTAVYDEEGSPEDAVRAVFTGAGETLEATDYEDACPIATVALEVASTDDRLRQATADVFEEWTVALTERLGDRDRALAVIAALEGAFVLSRALRSTEPVELAGEASVASIQAALNR